MRILGIDPGTATTGFGVIDKLANGQITCVDVGIISTPSTAPMAERLVTIHDEITQLIKQHRPEVVAIELLYFQTNVSTAMTVGQARGTAMLAAGQAKLPVAEYTPMQVKQAVTGYGRASKSQIQEMVKMLLKLAAVPKPDDAADALAIAITHANHRVLEASHV